MAVFTPLNTAQLEQFLQNYELGMLTSFTEVSQGTENSTFFISTNQRSLVLTLFEQVNSEEMPFFVELLIFLHDQKLPVTRPIPDRYGEALQLLADRPAVLFERLEGKHPDEPNLQQCEAIGAFMARLHLKSQFFPGVRPNSRDLHWIKTGHKKVLRFLNQQDQELLLHTLDNLEATLGYKSLLPQGVIHADLFRDNAFFVDNTLIGVIDFYNGCTGDFLYDLAVLVNDWCSDAQGILMHDRYHAIVDSYAQLRNFTHEEREAWPFMLQLTALRYWLSRLLVLYVDPPAHALTPKNPQFFRNMLQMRLIANQFKLP